MRAHYRRRKSVPRALGEFLAGYQLLKKQPSAAAFAGGRLLSSRGLDRGPAGPCELRNPREGSFPAADGSRWKASESTLP